MMVDTLKKNQNIPDTGALIAGITNTKESAISPRAAATRTFCCIGSRSFFTSLNVAKPDPRKTNAGKPVLRGVPSHATLGNGRSQPPQKSVTATEETTKMLAYSARK